MNAFVYIAPQEIKDAVRTINHNIHYLERRPYKKYNRLYISFNKDKYTRKKLVDEDYKHFEFVQKPNVLYIDYCEVGKTLTCLYKDGLPPDYEGARNMRHYTGDAINIFSQDAFFNRENWTIFPPGFEEWCKNYNIDYTDKKLGIGILPVAKIISNVDDSNFSSISRITNVEIL